MTRPYILLADSDPHVLRTRTRWLESAGFTVSAATSGQECLAVARAAPPQAILISAAMLGPSGIDLRRQMTSDPALDGCLVVVTAQAHATTHSAGWLADGADDCFAASISRGDLVARLQALLRLQSKADALRASERHAQILFSESSLPTWEADYSELTNAMRRLAESGVSDFRAYFDARPEAVVACVALIRVVRINRESLQFFGVASESDLSLHLADYCVDESWPVLKEGLIMLAQGETRFAGEYPLLMRNGEVKRVHLHIRAAPGALGDRDTLMISFADLTELQRVEESLEASEMSARALINALPAAAFLVSLDGVILDINAFAAAMLGATVHSLRGRSLYDLMTPGTRSFYEDKAVQAIQTAAPTRWKEERDGRHIEVSVYPISDGRGRAMRLAVVGLDVSESERIQAELERHRNHLEELVLERTADLAAANQQLTQAEAMLRQNEKRYRSLVEDLPVGLLRTSPSGQILDVNSAAVTLFGYPDRETMMAINAGDFYVSARDRDDFRATVEHETFATGYEAQVLRYDGTAIWVGWSARCFRNEQGDVLYYETTMEDITLWRQAVVALRESEARYRAVVEDDTSLICRFSLNGNLTFVNTAYCRSAGKTEEELLGSSFLNRVWPDDRLLAAASLTTLTPASPVRTYQHRALDERGEMRWQEWTDRAIFDADGFLMEYQGVGRDATEHRRADVALQEAHDQLEARVAVRTAEILIANLQLHEQISQREHIEVALRESEMQYRQLVTLAQEGIWVTRGDGRTTFANPRMEEMLGCDPGEMLGRSIFSFLKPDAIAPARTELERRKRGEKGSGDFEFVRKDGSTIYANLAVTALRDGGPGEGMLIVVADVTARRLAEDSLRRAKEAADSARADEQQRRREAERRRQIAEGVGEIMEALNSTQSLDETLEVVMARASELLACPLLILYRLDEEDGELTIRAAHGTDVEGISATDVRIATLSMDHALEGDQEVLVYPIEDILSECGCASAEEFGASLAAGYGTVMAVPIVIKGELYGAAQLYFEGSRDFSSDELDLAVVLGRQIALAVENALLRESRRASAIAAERNRLARDLHDAVTQTLFSANLIADTLPRVWQRDPAEGMKGLQELRSLTHGALAEMRSLLMELRPAVIEEKPLPEVLRQLSESLTTRTHLPISVSFAETQPLPPAVKVAFYRIAQEALNNVVKHAGASCAEIKLQSLAGLTRLIVSDDGVGFNPDLAHPNQLGVGIMRERARQVGADFVINSGAGQGTQVNVTWPSKERQTEHDIVTAAPDSRDDGR